LHVRFLALTVALAAIVLAQNYAERTISTGMAELHTDSVPAEMKVESAIYVQRRLGQWQAQDARAVLGEPLRRRDAYDEGAITGDIYAFRDPSNRYREFELLFDRRTRTLRSAFIYPWRMTWNDCRELWGDEVNSTAMSNGNVFHSYLNRRLDVLADRSGLVINLGIY
jgi:hypothetical protein